MLYSSRYGLYERSFFITATITLRRKIRENFSTTQILLIFKISLWNKLRRKEVEQKIFVTHVYLNFFDGEISDDISKLNKCNKNNKIWSLWPQKTFWENMGFLYFLNWNKLEEWGPAFFSIQISVNSLFSYYKTPSKIE